MQRDHHGRRSKAWESTIRKAHLQLRSCTIFSAMSVLPYDDDPSAAHHRAPPPPPDLHHVERLLPNGDFFTGLASASSGRPHGAGKYLWTDGCVYDGDWADGAPHGRGRFSWPSGATYEGEFASWLLEGSGTFTGASGDTYRGTFRSNLKHGRGRRTYPNGDYYDGEWRGGVQEGAGRYVWKSGHEYNGSWRDGRMGGKGVVFWADGSSYDGEWDEGVPGGKGQFRWPDGGVFLGIWGKDRRTGRAPILVSAAPENVRREPEEELEAALRDCEVCRGETVMLFPSQKVVHWSGKHVLEKLVSTDLPRLRRGSADTSQAPRRGGTNGGHGNGSRRRWESYGDVSCCNTDDSSGDGAGQAPATPRTPARWQLGGEGKKPGETISRGHKNYELMLNLQIGIRHAVGRTPQETSLDLKPSAFDPKDKIWTRFPPEGSKHTPPHQSCDFRWKDYCPGAFRTLRKLFNVDAADYMLSICGNDALRELSSPGKSGSFFYLSQDDRYMIKTVKKAEAKVLLKMLPAYYNHVKSHKNTLLTRFYGLHCVKLSGATQKKVRFVIMGNLFYMDYPIHRRFDLKGSSHGRITDKPESEIDETTTLKDLDLNFIFRLQKSWYHDFIWQLEQDSQFLENEKIMDYSLLVGVHFKGASSLASNTDGSVLTRSCSSGIPQPFRGDLAVCQSNLYDRCTPARLGISVPSEVELTGEQTGEYYDAFLFFGIIDILQDYDLTKKLEHAYKSMHHDPASISSVDPRQYSKRFRDFIIRVFKEAH